MEQSVKEQFVTYNQLKKLRKTFTDNPSISKGVLSVRIDVVDDHYRRFREVNIKINRIVIAENIVISKEKYFVEDLYSKFELLYMEIKGEILENYFL